MHIVIIHCGCPVYDAFWRPFAAGFCPVARKKKTNNNFKNILITIFLKRIDFLDLFYQMF